MKTVLICGYYGFGNAGDEMILASMLDSLGNRELYAPMVLSDKPELTESLFGVKAFDRWSVRSVFYAVSKADAVVLGGGGLFQDGTSSLSLYYYLSIIALARLLGKKVILWSVGLGPLRPANKIILKFFLKITHILAVRDSCSREIAHGSAKNIFSVEDQVLSWGRVKRKDGKKKYIGLCIKHSPNSENNFTLAVGAALYAQAKYGLSIACVPFFKSQDMGPSLKASESLPAEMFVWDKLEELVDFFSNKLAFCVTMRLHPAILCYKIGVPFAAVTGTDPEKCKLKRFLADYSLQGRGISDFSDVHSAVDFNAAAAGGAFEGRESRFTLARAVDSVFTPH